VCVRKTEVERLGDLFKDTWQGMGLPKEGDKTPGLNYPPPPLSTCASLTDSNLIRSSNSYSQPIISSY
jgi:hypothetical protein